MQPSETLGTRLLLVDDDALSRYPIAEALRSAGYVVDEAGDGLVGLEKAKLNPPQLVLLDLIMPKLSGWGTLEGLRSDGYRGAVIVLTANEDTETLVRALGQGADDFLPKPCVIRELFARVHAVLRRVNGASRGVIRVGAARVDFDRRVAEADGREIALTATEFKLLEAMSARPGRVVLRQELLREVWGYSARASSRTVDTHVWRLRNKLRDNLGEPRCLLTVPGGYRLVEASALPVGA